MIIFAVVLAALSGTLALALSLAFNGRVRTPADLTRAARVPCLVTVPKQSRQTTQKGNKGIRDDGAAAMEALATPFAASIRNLRTAITAALPPPKRGSGRSVAFVAWDRQAGCSFIASRLAEVTRKGGRPTILIETDFRSATASRSDEGPQATSSLADILYNRIPSETVRYRDVDGVWFLPAASRDPSVNYFADLGSSEMLKLLDSAAAKGDVYVDLPPLNETNDAAVVAQRVDAVVIVAREGKTRTDELDRAVRMLTDAGANVIGVVLNRL